MKAYSFRLQMMLRVRHVEAARANERVAKAARYLVVAERQERATTELYERETSQIVASQFAESTADTFIAQRERGLHLAEILHEVTATRTSLANELLVARRAAVAAEQRVAVLEKLDDRRRDEWLLALRREEALELDDFSITRAAIASMEHSDVD